MKQAWAILIISAITDLMISSGGVLLGAMMATGTATMPNNAVWLVALVTGAVSMARTIQQALKATPETSAALTGGISTVATTTLTKTP